MPVKIVPDIVHDQQIHAVTPGDSAREAAAIMTRHHVSALVVMKGDRLAGIVTERDITERLVAEGLDAESTKVEAIMSADPETVSPDGRAREVLDAMHDKGFRHMPVVDGDRVVGIVSTRDLLDAIHQKLENELEHRDAFVFGN